MIKKNSEITQLLNFDLLVSKILKKNLKPVYQKITKSALIHITLPAIAF